MAPIVEKKRKIAPTNESLSKRLRTTEDEPFPRGGGSLLTPLEHKQIQIEATRDVLFEQQGKSAEDAKPARKLKAKGKDGKEVKGKKGKGKTNIEPEDDTVKIEGLSYKRLVAGSLVLGQVSQINDHDIALSLPNNLTGYVPITSISDKVTQRIEKIAAAENEDEDKNMDVEDEEDDVDLEKLFKIGQYLRAYVVSTSDDSTESSGKSKRRIELSLRPHQSNNSIASQNVIVNNTLMASVASVEDHGLIMDLGLKDVEMKGFMSSKELGGKTKLSDVEEGAVFLCIVTGLSSNGKIVKLSADVQKMGNTKKPAYLTEAPTIEAFLPGTIVEILVADITPRGISGKVMGMLDVTADLMHSGAGASGKDMEKKYKIGSKIKGRVICTFPTSDPPKIGVSLLEHIMSMTPQQTIKNGEKLDPLGVLPISTIVEEVTVRKVEPGVGLFVDLGIKGVSGFVHISRVQDGKIETLAETTGPFKVGSVHRARLVGYNLLDGVYLVSLEKSVLDQAFLRIEDLKVGEIVKGTIEKIVVNEKGVGGLLINLADGITGLAPEMHMADVQLSHPEKIFKQGKIVTARVLSTDPAKRQIRLTLKKSLVNSEADPISSYEDIDVGMQSPGTIVNINPHGAVVQFYGTVRGFLPVAEMSEAYIQDPSQHFRIGQVVNTYVLKVDAENQKLSVTCKDPAAFGLEQQIALKKLSVGEIISAVVMEKSNDDIAVELQGSGLRAVLPVVQLTDGSSSKNSSALKRIRVGQVLTELAILNKIEKKRAIILTNRPSLVKDAKARTLLRRLEDAKENKIVHGFVKNITLTAVFVQFGGGLVGLLPKSKILEEAIPLPDFGMKKSQSLEVKIVSVDHGLERLILSMTGKTVGEKESATTTSLPNEIAIKPIDKEIKSVEDLTLGKLTKAKVVSIKDTQINVKLADNIQGRVDVSQIFDTWEQIVDRKHPLAKFSKDQIIPVRVLGIHDARNHRFLPITHRAGKTQVFELTAKTIDTVDQTTVAPEPLTLDKVELGSAWIAYVNNVGKDCVWVNLSPNVRGRIHTMNLSDDVSLLSDIESNFPIGSAIRVRVTGLDVANNRLDLSARSTQTSGTITFDNLTKGMIVPGKVTRVTERSIIVQLSKDLSAPVNLPDLADDFSQADASKHSKNEIIRVCISDIDVPNKKLRLSTRPSRVLNSSLTVKDPEISSATDVKVNNVIRGFINNVSDKGLFVNLGGSVTGHIRIADLSDEFVKDWKAGFQVDQLVEGKVIAVNENPSRIQLSLKASVLDPSYVTPLQFKDYSIGQIVEGKIRKVEDFGVFIVIDGSANVSGLCHQSEMAEKRVTDVRKLYEEGDSVKAIILKVDNEKKRVSFGLKASDINPEEGAESAEDSEDDDEMQGVKLADSDAEEDSDDEEESGMDLDVQSIGSIEQDDDDSSGEEMEDAEVVALDAGGFDWSANVLDEDDKNSAAESDDEDSEKPKKRKRKKTEIQEDRTGNLDINGPQSVSDFERLLLGEPDSSALWIGYMAFQLQAGELGKARAVAERAIKTINIRDDVAKKDIWVALLNLEVEYGNEETVKEVFDRACQFADTQAIHESLASIYIRSNRYEKADEIFQVLIKKFSQIPKVWENYANFLYTTYNRVDAARALLPRALIPLPPHTHLALHIKFASLEFKSTFNLPEAERTSRAERGRTMYEKALSSWPKRLDLWSQWLDVETSLFQKEETLKAGSGDKGKVRHVFEQMLKSKAINKKNSVSFFARWRKWEEMFGDRKSQEKVKAKWESVKGVVA